MKPPLNATELRTFLGMITYYRDMWPRRYLILTPFTVLSGLPKKAKIDWTNELDLVFKRVKAIIVQDVLMIFPNHNKDFDIYTDSSDYQLSFMYVSCRMVNQSQIIQKKNWCTEKLHNHGNGIVS